MQIPSNKFSTNSGVIKFVYNSIEFYIESSFPNVNSFQNACYHEVKVGNTVTKECLERPVTDSGYYHSKSHRTSLGDDEAETTSCRIKEDVCFGKFVDSAKECAEYSKNVKGGTCCMDIAQKFCFSQPYHSRKKDEYECVAKGRVNKISFIVLLVGLLAL